MGKPKDVQAAGKPVILDTSFGNIAPSGIPDGPKRIPQSQASPFTLRSIVKFHLSGLKRQGAMPGGRETVKVKLQNAGSHAVGKQMVELQISPEKLFKRSRKLGRKEFREIKAKRNVSNSFNIAAPRKSGMYYLRACLSAEKHCSEPVLLIVRSSKVPTPPVLPGATLVKRDNRLDTAKPDLSTAQIQKKMPRKDIILFPDLVVLSSRLAASKSNPGRKVKVTATVKNIGNGQSKSTSVDLFHSADRIISVNDAIKSSSRIPALKPKEEKKIVMYLDSESVAGNYYYGLCVGVVSQEQQKTNNCSKTLSLLVTAQKPSLIKKNPVLTKKTPMQQNTKKIVR